MQTLSKTVKAYCAGRVKSGAKGLELIKVAVDHAYLHGDTTPLAWLIAKTDPADSKAIRRIAGKVMGGAVLARDVRQPSGIRITLKENAAPTDKMAVLRVLVEEGVSFTSPRVKVELFDEEKEPTVFDMKKAAKSLAKRVKEANVSIEDMLSALNEAFAN